MADPTFAVIPDGRWLKAPSPAFHAFLGIQDADFDALAYAVRNLGVASVAFGRDTVNVTLRVPGLGREAAASVCNRLARLGEGYFHIHLLVRRWETEVYRSGIQAAMRVWGLSDASRASQPSRGYSARPLSLDRVFVQDNNPMKPLAQKWRASFGQFDDTVIPFLARKQLLDRSALVKRSKEDGDAIFSFIGAGFKFYGDQYPYLAVGEKVQDQPDRNYGAWTAEAYSSILDKREPQLHSVEAAISLPSGVLHVTQYQRLLLPWQNTSGESLVTCLSLVERTYVDEGPNGTKAAVGGSPKK